MCLVVFQHFCFKNEYIHKIILTKNFSLFNTTLSHTIYKHIGRVKINIPSLRNHKAPTPLPKAFN